MPAPSLAFDSEEVVELQSIIESLDNEEAMDAGVIDGLLTAYALVPEAKPFEIVYPYLFSQDGIDERVPDNARLRELVDLRRRVIAASLAAGYGLEPIILPVLDDNDEVVTGPEGLAALEPWVAGFRVGLMLVTASVPEMTNEARRAIATIVALAPEDVVVFSEEESQVPAYAAFNELPTVELEPASLEDGLMLLVKNVYALKAAWQPNRPVRLETPKVGRNDPCPCGSGKKYKQCCGKKA